MGKSRDSSSLGNTRVWHLGVLAVAVLLLFGALVWLLGLLQTGEPTWFWKNPSTRINGQFWFDLTRIAVTALGVVGVAIGGYLAYRRQRLGEQQHLVTDTRDRRDHERGVVSDLRDRFTTAAEQLGSPSSAIRLAGVYATAALADDWLGRGNPEEAQVCINLLCAYLRTPRQPATEGIASEENEYAAETNVRTSIISTFRAHLLEESVVKWSGLSFDLSNAVFDFDLDLSNATFAGSEVSFARATFAGGTALFEGATFSGSSGSFDEVTFAGEVVSFINAVFSGNSGSFYSATFVGKRAAFDSTTFLDHSGLFGNARFAGKSVSFDAAIFKGGVTWFGETDFSADVVLFSDVIFEDWVSFEAANFSGKRVSFDGANFTGGFVWFLGVTFSGNSVSFDGATFTGNLTPFGVVEFAQR